MEELWYYILYIITSLRLYVYIYRIKPNKIYYLHYIIVLLPLFYFITHKIIITNDTYNIDNNYCAYLFVIVIHLFTLL